MRPRFSHCRGCNARLETASTLCPKCQLAGRDFKTVHGRGQVQGIVRTKAGYRVVVAVHGERHELRYDQIQFSKGMIFL